jgi:GWxTD domain-containing protein
LLVINVDLLCQKKKDPWKLWLKDVELIITRLERSVVKLLKTDEERSRFKELFWKARDSNPQTPENEYRSEFYQRLLYTKQSLQGPRSDRGRIYILLGKPDYISNFSGHQGLVDCQLWSYSGKDRPGLLPFMNLVFFRQRNVGDFILYLPGIHQPADLFDPGQSNIRTRNPLEAYKLLKGNSTELARASLSIVPGEGDPRMGASLSSSNFALSRIYSLPEREAESGYIRSFKTGTGFVEVKHTTRNIRGFCSFSVNRIKNITFINYAVLPEVLKLKRKTDDEFYAEINIHINVEDETGKLIFHNERKIDLKFNARQRVNIDKRKIVFRDFLPVVEGNFHVTVTFMNRSTQEFFTTKKRMSVSWDKLSAAVGYKMKPVNTSHFLPYSIAGFLVLNDPRFTFSQKDALEGISLSKEKPDVYLKSDLQSIDIEPIIKSGDTYRFRLPLTAVKDGTYHLTIKSPRGEIWSQKINVLPFYIEMEKPLVMEHPEPPSAINDFLFIMAQQCMNLNNVDKAIEYFNKIPSALWSAESLPIIAKAYYMKKDFNRVIQLLEMEGVKKEYPVLLMLANSCIELKLYQKALEYLESIRKYGDTVEINHLLAATYINLGKSDKAKIYYERARKLINNNKNDKEKNKEKNHE